MLFAKLTRLLRHRGGKRTVLFAWELGGGSGHIHRLLAVATALESEAQGHRLVFVLRRPESAGIIGKALPRAKILRAPTHEGNPPPKALGPAHDYADVLHRCGYNSAGDLGRLVEQWRQLISSEEPSVIVADHSPTVILAASGGVPVVHIGSGFATPPAGRGFRALYPDTAKGAKTREGEVLHSIQEVQRGLGAAALTRVCDLLGLAEKNLACCLPELDPYSTIRTEPALGPVETLPEPAPIVADASVFGYLDGGSPVTPFVLESFAKANVRCGIYIRQCSSQLTQMAQGSSVTLYPSPQKMPEALRNAAAVVHHGGLSTAEAALALGRPQFLFPQNLEQALTARSVQKLSCGEDLTGHGNPGDFVSRALRRGAYRKETAAVATRIAARPVSSTLPLIVTAVSRHLNERTSEHNNAATAG